MIMGDEAGTTGRREGGSSAYDHTDLYLPPPPPTFDGIPEGSPRDHRMDEIRQQHRGEILFAFQVAVIMVVVITCAINLSVGHTDDKLNQAFVAMISSCLGIIIPTPSIQVYQSSSVVNSNNNRLSGDTDISQSGDGPE